MAASVVLVNGLPGAGKTTLARRLGAQAGWPCLSKDDVKEALDRIADGALPSGRAGSLAMGTVWAMAACVDGTVVVESWWFRPRDLGFARAGIATSGAAVVVEVWCDVDPDLARERYSTRRRAAVHRDAARLASHWDTWAAGAEPLAIGPVVRVDTGRPVDTADVARRVGRFLR